MATKPNPFGRVLYNIEIFTLIVAAGAPARGG